MDREANGEDSIKVPLVPSTRGSLTQTNGLQLLFNGISYSVRSNRVYGQTAQILRNISGFFEAGEMTALIGPSGSGKTTLVDVLAGRKTQGTITGDISYGGYRPTKDFLRKFTGYVEQFDTLVGSLTVYEMLLYTAELKRPISETHGDKKNRVDHLIHRLSLSKFRNETVGQRGGVKKRVNVGISMITEPKVLFLDEPTTGLDSFTANETMSVVKKMASEVGTTICSTIHSPTSFTFSLFDRAMFLLGGEVVFFGEREAAVDFFKNFSTGIDSSDFDNDADYLTATIVDAERSDRGADISSFYRRSELQRTTTEDLFTRLQSDDVTALQMLDDRDVRRHTVSVPSWFAFKTLLQYRSRKNLNDKMFWIPRLADKLVFLFLFILTYVSMGDEYDDRKYLNVVSILFLLAMYPAFGAGVYAPSIVIERPLLYRELDDGMYSTGVYLLMKIMEEMMIAIVASFVTTFISWFALSLQGNYLYVFLVYFGHLMNGITAAYVCAAVGTDVNMSNALLATYSAILCFFCGMLILPRDIPNYWKWLYYLDYAKYGFGVMMHNHFTSNQKAKSVRIGNRPDALTVLEYYELDDVNSEFWILVVYMFVVGHLLLAYFCTRFIRHQKR
eukprot:g7030.t1